MTEQEAIEYLKFHKKGLHTNSPNEQYVNLAIKALEIMQELAKRNMTIEDLENYMQFEDECVKKGFTFSSLLEARKKQIAKKPSEQIKMIGLDKGGKCPTCQKYINNNCHWMYCECGQKLDWSEQE